MAQQAIHPATVTLREDGSSGPTVYRAVIDPRTNDIVVTTVRRTGLQPVSSVSFAFDVTNAALLLRDDPSARATLTVDVARGPSAGTLQVVVNENALGSISNGNATAPRFEIARTDPNRISFTTTLSRAEAPAQNLWVVRLEGAEGTTRVRDVAVTVRV